MKKIEIEDEEDTEERRAEINAEDSIGGYDDMYWEDKEKSRDAGNPQRIRNYIYLLSVTHRGYSSHSREVFWEYGHSDVSNV